MYTNRHSLVFWVPDDTRLHLLRHDRLRYSLEGRALSRPFSFADDTEVVPPTGKLCQTGSSLPFWRVGLRPDRSSRSQIKRPCIGRTQIVFLVAALTILGAVRADEEVPQALCAFADLTVGNPPTGVPGAGGLEDLSVIKKGRRQIHGVTFDLMEKVVVLRKDQKLALDPKKLQYAGEDGIDSQIDRDRGKLVLHRIETVYLLHAVSGNAKDKVIGKWVFEYDDGSKVEEQLRMGENIGNRELKAEWSKSVDGGLYLTELINPFFDKNVKSVRVEIHGNVNYVLAGVTCKLGREPPHSF